MSTYGLFDDDGDLRFTYNYLEHAFKKKITLGWGYIYKIEVTKIGEEYE